MLKPNAVIFDMDGLLLESEKIALSTFIAACREYHFEPDIGIYYRCIGTTYSRTKDILSEGYGREFPYEAISELWASKYHEETWDKPVPLKKGVLSLLEYLQRENIKKAVVTSTRHERAVRKLKNAGILHFYEFVLGGDDILNGKPDPEIYLAACRRLNEAADRCLALEDSNNGVISAFTAGLTAVQVPDLVEPSAEVRALGHLILPSLSEVEALLKGL